MFKSKIIFSVLTIISFLYLSICFSLYYHEEKNEMKLRIVGQCGQEDTYFNSYIHKFNSIWEPQTAGTILGSAQNGTGTRGTISINSGSINATYVFELVQTDRYGRSQPNKGLCSRLSVRSILTPKSFFSLPFTIQEKNDFNRIDLIYPVFKDAMTAAANSL